MSDHYSRRVLEGGLGSRRMGAETKPRCAEAAHVWRSVGGCCDVGKDRDEVVCYRSVADGGGFGVGGSSWWRRVCVPGGDVIKRSSTLAACPRPRSVFVA